MTTATESPDMLTITCRATLQALRSGAMRFYHVARDVRLTLANRGLICEHTKGLLELTPRGRGCDPATFTV